MAHQLNRHEFEQTQGDGEGQGSLACCSPWGCKESDMTEQLNNKTVIRTFTLAFLLLPKNMPDPSPHLVYSISYCHDTLTPKLWHSPPFGVAWKSTDVSNGVKITHESLFVYITVSQKDFYTFTSKQPRQGFPDGPAIKNLPVQGTQVQPLVREDPTCCRATKPVGLSYRACGP